MPTTVVCACHPLIIDYEPSKPSRLNPPIIAFLASVLRQAYPPTPPPSPNMQTTPHSQSERPKHYSIAHEIMTTERT